MDDYAFTTDVEVRFRDIDKMGHVNNAVYATYLEQARARYYDGVLGLVLSDVPTVIVSLAIDYRASIDPTDEVTVGVRVPRLGNSSIPMEYAIYANGELAATGETVQVTTDRDTGRSSPIPDEWREQIEAFEGL